jgi:ABC-type transporter Mla maintaining outer membrane lipid asymmetry ATPase subunit MlaF
MDALIEVRGLRKNYGGLRPLRLNALSVAAGERVAVLGLDAAAAEVFVAILTGAALPDEGEVRIFGRATSVIKDADDWLATLDRIGMVSPRAMLPEELTVAQNIAIALTLSLNPVPDAVMADVERLAVEAGIPPSVLCERVASVTPLMKARCRLARALALKPDLLLLEHANALVQEDASVFGHAAGALASAHAMALLALTVDPAFARAAAGRALALEGATGELRELSGWRRWWTLGLRG